MNSRVKMAMLQRRRKDGTYASSNMPRYDREPYPFMGSPFFRPERDERPDRREYPDAGRMAMDTPDVYPMWGMGEVQPMNPIGFEIPRIDETGYHKGSKEQGHAMAYGSSDKPFSQEEAMTWVKGMKNADGTVGAHWSMEQVKQLMEQQKITLDEVDFFVTINMMYSDYCKVAKKMGVGTPEFYACMAKAFLEDKDAQPDKLARYYTYIVKH